MIPKCLKPYLLVVFMTVSNIFAQDRSMEERLEEDLEHHRNLFFMNCQGAYSGDNGNVFSAIYCTMAFLLASGVTGFSVWFQQALCGLGNEFPCNATVVTGGGDSRDKGGKHHLF